MKDTKNINIINKRINKILNKSSNRKYDKINKK